MKYHIRPTHIDLIRPGDVVQTGTTLRTVCNGDVRDGFMGKTLWGDSYRLGTLPVQLVVIETKATRSAA